MGTRRNPDGHVAIRSSGNVRNTPRLSRTSARSPTACSPTASRILPARSAAGQTLPGPSDAHEATNDPTGDHPDEVPVVVRMWVRKSYRPGPASGTKVAVVPVDAGCHETNPVVPGLRIWVSKTNPAGGGAMAHRMVYVSPTPPLGGVTRRLTAAFEWAPVVESVTA